jgi:hypothetical protein
VWLRCNPGLVLLSPHGAEWLSSYNKSNSRYCPTENHLVKLPDLADLFAQNRFRNALSWQWFCAGFGGGRDFASQDALPGIFTASSAPLKNRAGATPMAGKRATLKMLLALDEVILLRTVRQVPETIALFEESLQRCGLWSTSENRMLGSELTTTLNAALPRIWCD